MHAKPAPHLPCCKPALYYNYAMNMNTALDQNLKLEVSALMLFKPHPSPI